MTADRNFIAQSVASACTESAGTVQALAEEVGVSYAALCSWSRGRRRPPPHRLTKLAEVLDHRAERLRELANLLREQAGQPAQAAAPAAQRDASDRIDGRAATTQYDRSVLPLAASPMPGGRAPVAERTTGSWGRDAGSDRSGIRRERPGAIPMPPRSSR